MNSPFSNSETAPAAITAYERMMEDPLLRGAFLGTTMGVLRGHTGDPEYDSTRTALVGIVFPFVEVSPGDEARPVMLVPGKIVKGKDAILQLATEMIEESQ